MGASEPRGWVGASRGKGADSDGARGALPPAPLFRFREERRLPSLSPALSGSRAEVFRSGNGRDPVLRIRESGVARRDAEVTHGFSHFCGNRVRQSSAPAVSLPGALDSDHHARHSTADHQHCRRRGVGRVFRSPADARIPRRRQRGPRAGTPSRSRGGYRLLAHPVRDLDHPRSRGAVRPRLAVRRFTARTWPAGAPGRRPPRWSSMRYSSRCGHYHYPSCARCCVLALLRNNWSPEKGTESRDGTIKSVGTGPLGRRMIGPI